MLRCWTFAAVLAFGGGANALDDCSSNALVNAYAGLNVNIQLVSCIKDNNFAAALDGSVDLTSINVASAPEKVTNICASDSCKTILSTLVGSANFNLTNCVVGNGIVLMTEISNLQATCTALDAANEAPIATTAAPVPTEAPVATTAAPVPTEAPTATTAAPTAAPTETPVVTTAAPVATTATPTDVPVATTAAPIATTAAPVPTEAPVATTAAPVATEAPTATTAASTAAPTETPITTTAAPVPTDAPVATTAAPLTTDAPIVTTTAPYSDDTNQQEQQTTFSVLNSDSGSAAGVSPGKHCDQ